jgi:hypothetical protein
MLALPALPSPSLADVVRPTARIDSASSRRPFLVRSHVPLGAHRQRITSFLVRALTARTLPIAPAPKAKAKARRRLTRRPRSSFLLPLARSATSATNIPHQRIVCMGSDPSTLGLILLSLNRCIHCVPSLPLPLLIPLLLNSEPLTKLSCTSCTPLAPSLTLSCTIPISIAILLLRNSMISRCFLLILLFLPMLPRGYLIIASFTFVVVILA